MSAIGHILQLHREYIGIGKEWVTVRDTLARLKRQYGERGQRAARLNAIRSEINSLIGSGNSERVKDLQEERTQILAWGQELHEIWAHKNALHDKAEAVRTEINNQAQYLGLPGFRAENGNGSSFITRSGTVRNFSPNGRYVLDFGTYVTYGSTTVVLDSAEQIVAYQSGGSAWTVTPVGDGYWERYKASLDRDTGLAQTNFFSGTVGEKDQKKKVHVAIDELGNVVFVRDVDGGVLYDRKKGIGHLPPDLNWDR